MSLNYNSNWFKSEETIYFGGLDPAPHAHLLRGYCPPQCQILFYAHVTDLILFSFPMMNLVILWLLSKKSSD